MRGVHTALSRPWSADNRATELLSRCYAAQWPCQCLCCLSMVFSIFVADVIFWLWWRLERIRWITLGLSGCQKPHSASLPRCNSVLLGAASRRRRGIYLTSVWSDVTVDTAVEILPMCHYSFKQVMILLFSEILLSFTIYLPSIHLINDLSLPCDRYGHVRICYAQK